jgi:hypothetical protein
MILSCRHDKVLVLLAGHSVLPSSLGSYFYCASLSTATITVMEKMPFHDISGAPGKGEAFSMVHHTIQ